MFQTKKYLFFFIYLLSISFSSFVFTEDLSNKPLDPQIFVVFGGTGDLAHKKIFPALEQLQLQNELPKNFVCLGIGTKNLTSEKFQETILKADQASLKKKIFYVQANILHDEDFIKLKSTIEHFEESFKTQGNRLFYLATAPSFFPIIVQKLKEHGLIYSLSENGTSWSRVIIEKPLGHDYNSALQLKQLVESHLDPSQIYLIDHYVGKEVIQNIPTFRFSNPLFENLWNKDHIESVHITLSEEIGIGERGAFWEETGLLRDLIQNHVMQILTLIAMEKPKTQAAEDIHQKKIELLKAIRPFTMENLDTQIIRGQYEPGFVEGHAVKGYLEENHVDPKSTVETFIGARLYIDNPRWIGVPFYLKAGKRLNEKLTEVAIHFKKSESHAANQLIFRIQPNEEIALIYNSQVPNVEGTVVPTKMLFNYRANFKQHLPDAYERLIHQGMAGDKRLFVHFDESLISWKIYNPILEYWKKHPQVPYKYAAGSQGPQEVQRLFLKSNP